MTDASKDKVKERAEHDQAKAPDYAQRPQDEEGRGMPAGEDYSYMKGSRNEGMKRGLARHNASGPEGSDGYKESDQEEWEKSYGTYHGRSIAETASARKPKRQ